jgi:low affinity Fe/Cu permease
VSEGQNRFIGIEHLTDEELEAIIDECETYADDLREAVATKRKTPHDPAGDRTAPKLNVKKKR